LPRGVTISEIPAQKFTCWLRRESRIVGIARGFRGSNYAHSVRTRSIYKRAEIDKMERFSELPESEHVCGFNPVDAYSETDM
jgi:hypothetical protein